MLALACDNCVQIYVVMNISSVVRYFKQMQQFDGHTVHSNHIHLVLEVLTKEERQFWPVLLRDVVVVMLIFANAHLLIAYIQDFQLARVRALDYSEGHLLLWAVDAHINDGWHYRRLGFTILLIFFLDA